MKFFKLFFQCAGSVITWNTYSYACLRRELYKTHGMGDTTYECTYYRLITTLILTPRNPVMGQQHMSEGPRDYHPKSLERRTLQYRQNKFNPFK